MSSNPLTSFWDACETEDAPATPFWQAFEDNADPAEVTPFWQAFEDEEPADEEPAEELTPAVVTWSEVDYPTPAPDRIVLIGCSKTKYDTRGRLKLPQELYAGQLFKKRVAYAERIGAPWAVLSARHGLWWPTHAQRTYDETLVDKSPLELKYWHTHAALSLLHYFDEFGALPATVTIELHAGVAYREPLATILRSLGFRVEVPCEGLGIGQQLNAYTTGHLSPAATCSAAA